MTTGEPGWKPAVYKSSTLTELPKPISSLLIKSSWDARESKVPLKNGATSDGQSKNNKVITLEASCALISDTNFVTEIAMYDKLAALEDVLDTTDLVRFEFFVYHNTDIPVYRKFKNCWCKTYDWSVGDDVHFLFKYSLEIFAEDPVSYSTEPGS